MLGGWFAWNCVGGEGGFWESGGGDQDQGGQSFAPHIRQVEVSFWVQISSILDEYSCSENWIDLGIILILE